jgi:Reverse transcriptase (RNA-dependent DNA polymerase)
VCRGFKQKYGVNFELVYAPVGKHTTLRVLLAYAAKYNYPTKRMDVKTAFLQSPVDEVIYVSQPQGYEKRGADGELLVMKLKKSLYGLKQAPRNWHKTFEAFLLSIGFTKSTADPCLFVRSDGTLLLLYVDDLAIVAKTEEKLETLSQQLQSHFSMTDEGVLALYLGMQVIRDPITGDIELTQSHYVQTLLERFEMANCHSTATPAVTSVLSTTTATTDDFVLSTDGVKKYKSAVGALLYLSVCTRPDITHAVMQLTRHMASPTDSNWAAVKKVFRYLSGHQIGLHFASDRTGELVGYADASFASDPQSRRSTSGYVFMWQGCAVSWRSKVQPLVTLSSTEAEYVALCSAAQEAVYLRRLFDSIGEVQTVPTVVFEDNMSTIALAVRDQDECTDRTKHIDVRYHYTRDLIVSKQMLISAVW